MNFPYFGCFKIIILSNQVPMAGWDEASQIWEKRDPNLIYVANKRPPFHIWKRFRTNDIAFFFQFGRPLFTTSGFAIQNDNLEVGFHVGVVSYYIPIHGLSYPINWSLFIDPLTQPIAKPYFFSSGPRAWDRWPGFTKEVNMEPHRSSFLVFNQTFL